MCFISSTMFKHYLTTPLTRAAFIQAHKRAGQIFKEEFTNESNALSAAEKVVLDESAAQVRLADKALLGIDREDVKMIKSHYACHGKCFFCLRQCSL